MDHDVRISPIPGLLLVLCLLGGTITPAFDNDLERGKTIFATNCASCHGANGQPDSDSPLVEALGVVPASFSDALFNSREPASTWKVVITHGGPEMGFSNMMPAFGETVPTHNNLDWELLPYLAFGKILSDEWTLQASGRLKLNLDNSDKSSAEFAGIVHWVHTQKGRAVFPGLELVAEVPFGRGIGPGRIDSVQFSALPQLRIGLNKRGNIALNTGVELPLNDRERYDWRVYTFLIWDFADGGFFEGW